jgi:hypothetical protein
VTRAMLGVPEDRDLGFLAVALLPVPGEAAARGLLRVGNKHGHTLGIVDPEAERQLIVVPESGVTGREVDTSPDGRTACVPSHPGEIWVIKPKTWQLEESVDVDRGSNGLALAPLK